MTTVPAWRTQVHRYSRQRRRAWLFALLLGVIGASVVGIVILA
jgi:hypothetical protein